MTFYFFIYLLFNFLFTFSTFKTLVDLGIDYKTTIAFLMQPAITAINVENNKLLSQFVKNYGNAIDLGIKSIITKYNVIPLQGGESLTTIINTLSKDSKLDWLQHEVEKVVDKEPQKFLNVVKDKSLFTKILINEAIEKGIVVKKANKYSTVDGLELCEAGEVATFDNAVRYLDELRNQEVRTIIEAKLEKAK